MIRIVVPSALLGVGVLANSSACSQTLYRAKQEMQEMQEETQKVFSGCDARGIDN